MTLLGAMKEAMGLTEFVDLLIEKTGLEEQYRKEDTEEAADRIENMNEFRNGIREYAESEDEPTLEGYLENVSLVTDLDRETDSRGYVTMMTLHSAKGLEFDNVFIPGLEENIFPSMRSLNEENRLEEERRLMYVGITRARKRLFLSCASERMLYNQYSHNPPSRFLKEIPARLIHASFSREENNFSENNGTSRFFRTGIPAEYGKGNPTYGSANSGYKKPVVHADAGKPALTLKGKSLNEIPGVTKGFGAVVQSAAREHEDAAVKSLFSVKDRVRHPKFGMGTVTDLSGSGANARITIRFDDGRERMLSLAVAPIIRMEDNE